MLAFNAPFGVFNVDIVKQISNNCNHKHTNRSKQMTELMVLPSDKKGIEQVFIEGQDIDSTIAKIREEAKNLPVDMTVRKNREEEAEFCV